MWCLFVVRVNSKGKVAKSNTYSTYITLITLKFLVLYKFRSLHLYKFTLCKVFYKRFRSLKVSLYAYKEMMPTTVKYSTYFLQKLFGVKA